MTFEEKKSLRDEHKALVRKLCFHNGDWLAMQRRLDPTQEIIQEHDRLKAQADKILSRLNYPRMDGTMHADEIKAAWSEYWEGNPPHPNFDWGKGDQC